MGCTGMKMGRHGLLVNARNAVELGVKLEHATYKLTTEVGSLRIEGVREFQHTRIRPVMVCGRKHIK